MPPPSKQPPNRRSSRVKPPASSKKKVLVPAPQHSIASIFDEVTQNKLKNGTLICTTIPNNEYHIRTVPHQALTCDQCGFYSSSLEGFHKHLQKPCVNPDPLSNSQSNKYVPVSLLKSVKAETTAPHGFTYNQKLCIIHSDKYHYTCVCGAFFVGSTRLRGLNDHISQCSLVQKMFPTNGTCAPKLDLTDSDLVQPQLVVSDWKRGGRLSKTRGTIETSSVLGFVLPPTTTHKNTIASYCRQINILLNHHWEEIERIVAEGYEKCPDCESERDFGAVSIQSERIEICVQQETGGGRRGTRCWDYICEVYNNGMDLMPRILSYAQQTAQKGLHFDTFSVIATKSSHDQHPHIDLASPSVQFGMFLSDGVTSTIAYHVTDKTDPKSPAFNDDIRKLFRDLSADFKLGTKSNVTSFLDKLQSVLVADPPFRERFINEGWFRLFQVCFPAKYQTHLLENVSAGTLTTIQGGVVHKGAGVEDKTVRSVLFFTGSPSESQSYNSDVQHTAITVFIQFCARIWKPGKGYLPEIIAMLQVLLQQCHSKYRASIANHYPTVGRTKHIHALLSDLTNTGKSYDNNYILRIVKKYAHQQKLFPKEN